MIEMEKRQEINGWLELTLKTVGGNVEVKQGGTKKTAWVTLEGPETPVTVALQQYPGAGTQPKDTITLVELNDIVYNLLTSLEDAVNKKTGDW
jgi:hypothetical protein